MKIQMQESIINKQESNEILYGTEIDNMKLSCFCVTSGTYMAIYEAFVY